MIELRWIERVESFDGEMDGKECTIEIPFNVLQRRTISWDGFTGLQDVTAWEDVPDSEVRDVLNQEQFKMMKLDS